MNFAWSKIRRKESIRSSTASSSSDSSSCRSSSPASRPGSSHMLHHSNGQHVAPQPTTESGFRVHPHPQPPLVSDYEFGPMGTIKRKPSNMNPKLPLTSTTRIIANHSGDDSRVSIVLTDRKPVTRSASRISPTGTPHFNPSHAGHQQSSQTSNGHVLVGNMQYGTLKSMRRSNTDERMSVTSLMSAQSGTSLESGFRCSQTTSESSSIASHPMEELDDDDLVDDLPLPPPPPVPLASTLTSSVSTLSLSNLPPPPPEFASEFVTDDTRCPPPTDNGLRIDSRQVSPSSTSSSSCCQSSGRSEDRSSYSSLDQEDVTLTRHQPVHHNHFTPLPHHHHQHQQSKSSHHKIPVMRSGEEDDFTAVDHQLTAMMRTRIANSSDLGVRMNPAAADSCLLQNHAPAAATCCQSASDVQTHLLQQHHHRHRNSSSCQQCALTGSHRQPEGCALISSSCARISSSSAAAVAAKLDPSRKFKPMYSSSSSCSSCEASGSGAGPQQQHSHEDIMTAALESDATPILINQHPGQGSGQARNGGVNGNSSSSNKHLSNQVAEKIYDSVFTYRKHVTPAAADAGSDSSALIASANQSPHSNEGAALQSANMSVTVSASYHHPPRQQLRSPMRGPLPASPEDFLRNIQRVMEKKWKVAQTLSVDVNPFPGGLSPPVMGFRETAIIAPIPEADPLPADSGSCLLMSADPAMPLPPPPPENYRPTPQFDNRLNGYNNCKKQATMVPAPFKRTKSLVPPKPPKRSESTRLSGIRHPDIRA